MKILMKMVFFPIYMMFYMFKLMFSMFSWMFIGFTILVGMIFGGTSKA